MVSAGVFALGMGARGWARGVSGPASRACAVRRLCGRSGRGGGALTARAWRPLASVVGAGARRSGADQRDVAAAGGGDGLALGALGDPGLAGAAVEDDEPAGVEGESVEVAVELGEGPR